MTRVDSSKPIREPLPVLLKQTALGSSRSPATQLLVGILAALLAVAIRYSLPLLPTQLPVLTVIVTVAITTAFVGLTCGITTAIVGGLLSWYMFFTPFSWDMGPGGAIPLLGFAVTASVIISTIELWRRSEQRHHQAELIALQKEVDASRLFAREMAHRLKNALAIVQSIAFQTLGDETVSAERFAGRLRALADTHDLLSEHIDRPTADVREVVKVALRPFGEVKERLNVDIADARIAAQQAVSLALALHELCTNALNFGALSTEAGSVQLKIKDVGDRLQFDWAERNGPPVLAPDAPGFGVAFLRRLGTEAKMLFERDGLRCTFTLRKA